MNELVKLDHYVVVGANSWAKADDLTTAFWKWWKEARPGSGGFYSPKGDVVLHVRQVDENAYVDGMGTLYAAKESIKLPDITLTKALIDKYESVMGDVEELLLPAEEASDLTAWFDGIEKEGAE